MADLVTRIPADELAQCQSWSIPEVGSKKVVPGVTEKRKLKNERKDKPEQDTENSINEKTTPNNTNTESIVDETIDEQQVKPLTAEQLEQITKDAEKDGYDAGYEKGFLEAKEKGYQEGLDEAKSKVAEECQRLNQLMQALLIPLENQQVEMEKQLLDMVCSLTRAVVGRELKTDSSHIVSLVQQSLLLLPISQEKLHLYLNSQDIELIQSTLTDLPENLQLQVDDNLLPGGCRLENGQSSLDDSIERRLHEVLDGFVHKRFSDNNKDAISDDEDETSQLSLSDAEEEQEKESGSEEESKEQEDES